MMRTLLFGLVALIGATSFAAAANRTLDGRWLTQEGRAIVEIAPCKDDGKAHCGTILWVKDPINPETGKPRHDKNNPEPSLQRRPIIGLQSLWNIVPNTEGAWNAVSYDPRNGEEHEITMTPTADMSKMVLQGCGLGGLICRSQTWTKAPDGELPPLASN
jgi:uncharacterized protein (DUF2147 family)